MPMDSMTEKEKEVFDYIIKEHKRLGVYPSYSMMAAHFDVSKSAIAERMSRLQRKGFIRVDGHRAYTILKKK